MGLFNLFNRKENQLGATESSNFLSSENKDISENLFIEKEDLYQDVNKQDLNVIPKGEQQKTAVNENGINVLYQFFEKSYEAKGYDDALINPDSDHLQQNIISLKYDLERNIKKVKTFYEDFINEIDFHITSRSRSGMVDTVEELEMKKSIAENHTKKVLEIEEDAKNNRGDCQGIVMSYTRGFRNGLAAISNHSIINRKF